MLGHRLIRRGLPILLCLAGASLLVYGSAFSRHEVWFEEKVTPAPPPDLPPPPFIRPGPDGAMPPFMQPPGPPPPPLVIGIGGFTYGFRLKTIGKASYA